jgi:peptidoglycan/xylan/chitin deacetylase (PgdA/CDA1 family)
MRHKAIALGVLSLATALFAATPAAAFQPKTKIVFTFDVTNETVVTNTFPVLNAHGMPAVVYVETALMALSESWTMTWQQLQDLQNLYHWEIGSHTINHPDLTQVTDAQLDKELKSSKSTLNYHGLYARTFATPLGKYDSRVLAAIAKHYESNREAWEGPNLWPEKYNEYDIKALEIERTTTLDEVKQWVEDAIAYDQTLVILMHEVVTGVPQDYQYNVDDFRAVVDYVASRPIPVMTMSAALQYSTSPNLISNPSFSTLSNGWASNWTRSDATNITIDQNSHGNFTGAAKSLAIVGGAEAREARTKLVSVNGSADYVLRMYQNVQDLTAGGWAVWVDEYSASNGWLSGQWLGGHWDNFVGTTLFDYKPTSPTVARVQFAIYTEENSALTLYVDSVDLRQLP